MTRDENSRERRSFLLTLATELESHLENGSDFIYLDDAGEDDAPEEGPAAAHQHVAEGGATVSKTKQPKRRKVWVTFDRLSLCAVFSSRARATAHARDSRVRWAPDPDCYESVVAFVEVRPGDVLLSREGAKARKEAADALERWLKDNRALTGSDDEHDHIRHTCAEAGCDKPVADALALLRGRR